MKACYVSGALFALSSATRAWEEQGGGNQDDSLKSSAVSGALEISWGLNTLSVVLLNPSLELQGLRWIFDVSLCCSSLSSMDHCTRHPVLIMFQENLEKKRFCTVFQTTWISGLKESVVTFSSPDTLLMSTGKIRFFPPGSFEVCFEEEIVKLVSWPMHFYWNIMRNTHTVKPNCFDACLKVWNWLQLCALLLPFLLKVVHTSP